MYGHVYTGVDALGCSSTNGGGGVKIFLVKPQLVDLLNMFYLTLRQTMKPSVGQLSLQLPSGSLSEVVFDAAV
jgi:hypothetical protein